MKTKFREGFKDDEIFSTDPLSGMSFDSKKAETNRLYYTDYDGDLFVVKKLPDSSISFGMIEDEN